MEFTVGQVSELINGTIEGNVDGKLFTISKIEEGKAGSLTFLANPKYQNFIYTTKATAVIVSNDFIPEKPLSCTLIRVEDAYQSFAKILEFYNQVVTNKSGIEKNSHIGEGSTYGNGLYLGAFAVIGNNCKIGENVKIHPNVVIGDHVTLGDNTILYAGVNVYTQCHIGKDCMLHSGSIIGSDGFGFAPNADGSYNKVSQIGNVIIEDNVEIGANTTIDRATLGSTIIRKGVKLDNLIQIAHNVEIGENTVIASQAGVSGSTKIGKNCVIGGQVGIVGHITIADGSKINSQSGVAKSIKEENKPWNGSPATHFRDSLRSHAVYRRLPELEKKLEELEQLVRDLKQTTF
ncbi:MAG: UDP-3-O-[3-hydroxymyristoyl] glucosamine N-acyltransferase [Sphingobacteriales bacterium]|jgi:UDP-3-O-[3-hydroxymyristoyl] glucosamine N-acyltransferase